MCLCVYVCVCVFVAWGGSTCMWWMGIYGCVVLCGALSLCHHLDPPLIIFFVFTYLHTYTHTHTQLHPSEAHRDDAPSLGIRPRALQWLWWGAQSLLVSRSVCLCVCVYSCRCNKSCFEPVLLSSFLIHTHTHTHTHTQQRRGLPHQGLDVSLLHDPQPFPPPLRGEHQ